MHIEKKAFLDDRLLSIKVLKFVLIFSSWDNFSCKSLNHYQYLQKYSKMFKATLDPETWLYS